MSEEEKTVLLVDDDTDLLELNKFSINNMGYDVITAENGEEAVAAYKETKPNIVIMDIKMPKMDGFDAFARMKKFDPQCKVALITAYSIDEKKLLKAQSMGLIKVINKPYEFDDIEKLIKYNT